MTKEARAELMRLKRWLGKERARYDRIADGSSTFSGQDRARSEANVCSLTMSKIDVMIRTAQRQSKGQP